MYTHSVHTPSRLTSFSGLWFSNKPHSDLPLFCGCSSLSAKQQNYLVLSAVPNEEQ